ncbi:MAG: lipoate--protein ligase family protein [Leptolyngbyaceae cyanobacterium SL_1_1]|nr:lipoate--protein ligase family protein [Leptolyngbyaceae cyanobacterium RM1_1_2]NJO11168.1 lipoate--protein ligase family protein [Leptolyngbyaceae cyanobacterium SL_1_1]
MALDRWLLDQHCLGLMPSVLRFYRWQPVAISLGYHQRRYPDYWSDLTWQGQPVDLVRRPSGGRAVLHQGDLTYAVITSASGSRQQVYEQICEFLVQGWRSLGLPLRYGTAGRGYIHNPGCFTTATAADLVLENGAKLVGSAQLRRAGGLLQHGSMPLRTEASLYQQIFGSADSLPDGAVLGSFSDEQIIAALVSAAQKCWLAEFEAQSLTPDEYLAATQSVVAVK